jgi:hypothetical protein
MAAESRTRWLKTSEHALLPYLIDVQREEKVSGESQVAEKFVMSGLNRPQGLKVRIFCGFERNGFTGCGKTSRGRKKAHLRR